jgi:hypothetical protein
MKANNIVSIGGSEAKNVCTPGETKRKNESGFFARALKKKAKRKILWAKPAHPVK